MKSLKLLTLLIFLSPIAISAQMDYSNYYRLVDSARAYQAKNEISTAINIYDSAFSLAYPFPEDLIEQIKCYELDEQLDKIPNALIELVQHGYKFRENSPIFGSEPISLRKLPLKDDYISTFANTYDSLRTKIIHAQDYDANDIMHICRTYANSLSNIEGVMNNDSIFQAFIDIVDYSISKEFILLFKDTTYNLSRQHNDFWDDPYWNLSILSALRGVSEDSIKLEELHLLLKEQINRGNFHPNTYSYICKLLADSIKRNIVSVSEFMPDKFSFINPIFKITVDTVEVEKSNYPQYYELTNKALTYFVQKKFNNAAKYYEQAFEIAYPFQSDLYILLECYNKLNMPEKEYDILQRLVLCGFEFISDRRLLQKPRRFDNSRQILKNITNPELIEKLKLEYDSLRRVCLSNIDIEMSRYSTAAIALENFTEITRWNPKIQTTSPDYFTQQSGFFFINLYESNIHRKKTIEKWNDGIFVISLVHGVQNLVFSHPHLIEKFLFLIFKQVKLGNLHPNIYSMLYDEVDALEWIKKNGGGFIKFKKCEITFGAKPRTWRKLLNIKNVEDVDKLRAKNYLPPLWVECKWLDYKLPKGYKYEKVKHK